MTKKNRHIILGCLVIVALVILVLPLFESKQSVDIDASRLNPPPFPDQSVNVTVKETEAFNLRGVDKPISETIPANTMPAGLLNVADQQKDGMTNAWLVQAGSFKNKANAVRLVNRLRASSYHAFIESINNQTFRVYVGPHHKKSDASVLASQLNKELKLDSVVVNYKPFTL